MRKFLFGWLEKPLVIVIVVCVVGLVVAWVAIITSLISSMKGA